MRSRVTFSAARIFRSSLRTAAAALCLILCPRDAVPEGADSYRTLHCACGPFIVHHPARLEPMAREVSELLCGSMEDIGRDLGLGSIDTITVVLAPDEQSYRRLHRGLVPEWGAAFSATASQVLGIHTAAVLRSPRPLRIILRHELSHLLLAQRVGGVRCPVWFMEGLAMIHSHEWSFRDQWELMGAVWRKNLPYLEDLDGAFPAAGEKAAVAYRLSYTAVMELISQRPRVLSTLTAFTRESGSFDRAFVLTFGETVEDFDGRFRDRIVEKYRTGATLVRTVPYWSGLALLVLAAYFIKRMRGRRKLAAWEVEEAGGP